MPSKLVFRTALHSGLFKLLLSKLTRDYQHTQTLAYLIALPHVTQVLAIWVQVKISLVLVIGKTRTFELRIPQLFITWSFHVCFWHCNFI